METERLNSIIQEIDNLLTEGKCVDLTAYFGIVVLDREAFTKCVEHLQTKGYEVEWIDHGTSNINCYVRESTSLLQRAEFLLDQLEEQSHWGCISSNM